jgi:hypothetical protein
MISYCDHCDQPFDVSVLGKHFTETSCVFWCAECGQKDEQLLRDKSIIFCGPYTALNAYWNDVDSLRKLKTVPKRAL